MITIRQIIDKFKCDYTLLLREAKKIDAVRASVAEVDKFTIVTHFTGYNSCRMFANLFVIVNIRFELFRLQYGHFQKFPSEK